MTARRDELASRLRTTRERIERACLTADRDPAAITLVVVTKTHSAQDVLTLLDLGVTDIGENRDQEASAKITEVRACSEHSVTVHFIGQLQTNKARSVCAYADVVQSVDRTKLVRALEKGAADRAVETRADPLDVLVQVSLDEQAGDAARAGVAIPDLPSLAEQVCAASHLRLRGLMAVAPLGADPDRAFARLASAAARLREEYPEASRISAGMSGDLEAAVRHGATHLRVGTAILGTRPPLR